MFDVQWTVFPARKQTTFKRLGRNACTQSCFGSDYEPFVMTDKDRNVEHINNHKDNQLNVAIFFNAPPRMAHANITCTSPQVGTSDRERQ